MDRKKVWEIRSGKVQAWLETAALAAGSALFGGLVLLLAFCGEYPERLADNRYLILMGLMCGLGGGALYYFWSHKEWKWHVKRPAFWMAAGYLLIFALQVFWVSKVYFYMGWDVNMLQYRVEAIVNGGSMAETSADFGYSIYPNNLLLFYVFCIIEKIAMLFSMEEPFHLCIYISCLCVNLACFLGHLMVRRLTGPFMQGCYMVVCLPFILFSPWIMSPYSDTYGMFFVALGMWALTCLDRKYLKWIVGGFAAIIGYHVKPTCIFVLFAAWLVYGIRLLLSLRERWKELAVLVCSTVVFWCMGLCIPLWIQHTYSFRLMPEYEMPYTHFLMMGFSESTYGAYDHDDFEYSIGFPDVEPRKAANLEAFRIRVELMWEQGTLLEFLKNKALLNYNDGTFAWGWCNGFYALEVEHDNLLADWFQDIMVKPGMWDNEGKYFSLYKTFMQFFWLQILMGIMLNGFFRKERRAERACMMTALCGLLVFHMIFEAQARYPFLYTPVFLVLSLCGVEEIWRKGKEKAGRLLGKKSVAEETKSRYNDLVQEEKRVEGHEIP